MATDGYGASYGVTESLMVTQTVTDKYGDSGKYAYGRYIWCMGNTHVPHVTTTL